MAKAKKTESRPWQKGPRKKNVKLGPFWFTLAQLLTRERETREWSTVAVEKNGGPSYGIVQEHERGNFRSIRALMLHLAAFGWHEADTFANVMASEREQPILDQELLAHIRTVHSLRQLRPRAAQLLMDLAAMLSHAGEGSVQLPTTLTFAELLAVGQGSEPKKRVAR